MSTAPARSPSPGPPARPCCGLRRSSDSSPFRPAASPQDSPRRSSSVCRNSGRASPRTTWGTEKENDPRDTAVAGAASARTHKVRSSGGCGGGGSGVAKSFMAPTISAASKAVAPSGTPRKKILGERNSDAAPSSPVGDLARGSKPREPHPAAPQPGEALGAPRRLRLSLDEVSSASALPPPPPADAPVASRGVWSFGGDEEAPVVVVGNPVSMGDHHHAASVDASEAVAPPYDPKTNYLSPRPRYLRYQPNRRLEMYRHGGGGVVRGLEDIFSSEEVDTTATTTTEEEVSGEEQPDDSSSSEETSALSSSLEARTQSAAPAMDALLLPQPALDSPLAPVLTPEGKKSPRASVVLRPEQQEPVVSSRPRKKRSFMRFLIAPISLLLLMAAAFVCVPPPPGHPVMLNTSLSKVSEFLSVQELQPVELAARLKQWSSSSLDFVMSYWEAIASYQERDVFGPHVAANLSAAAATDVDADYDVDFYYSATQTSLISVEELEIEEVVSESDAEMTAGPDVEELATCGDSGAEPIDDDDVEVEQKDVSGVPSAMEEANVDAEVEGFDAEMAEEVSGSGGEETVSIQNSDIPSQSTPEPEQSEGTHESSLDQTKDSEGDHADGKEDPEAYHGQKLGSDMWPRYLDKIISNPAAIGAAVAAIIVPAALAFLYMRQKQARVASNEPAEQVEQDEQVELIEQVKEVESLSGSGSSQGHAVAKDSQFQNPSVEEAERLGGSGPSQYSSSLSSGRGRRRNTKGEDMSRRDSTAQSTSSYGSFTTYQKISAKKGNKEDEAMTPVRRSSRLRNVKTPEA